MGTIKAFNEGAATQRPGKTILIGIDPDVDRCGVAVKNKAQTEFMQIKPLPFFDLLNLLNIHLSEGNKIIAYVDAGWLISKSNWHEAQGKRGEKIAKNVGGCHQVGKLVVEFCRRKGIEVYEVKPKGSKIGALAFAKYGVFVDGKRPGRINQDCRDAAMLILGR